MASCRRAGGCRWRWSRSSSDARCSRWARPTRSRHGSPCRGTPTQAGSFYFSVIATDSNGDGPFQGAGNYNFTVYDAPATNLRMTLTASAAQAMPGTQVHHVVRAANAGQGAVIGASLSPFAPMGLGQFTWTCSASGGAACESNSGSGVPSGFVDLPVGSEIVYNLTSLVEGEIGTVAALTYQIDVPPGAAELFPGDNRATALTDVVGEVLLLDGFE